MPGFIDDIGAESMEGANASDFSVDTPRGIAESNSWRWLVVECAKLLNLDELERIAGLKPARIPVVLREGSIPAERESFYFPVHGSYFVYGNVSANYAVHLIRWLFEAVELKPVAIRRRDGSRVHQRFRSRAIENVDARAGMDGLGEWLKLQRVAADLTQEELASLLSTTQPIVSSWELGKRVPDDDVLLHIEDLFGSRPNVGMDPCESTSHFDESTSNRLAVGGEVRSDGQVSRDTDEQLSGTNASQWILATPRGDLQCRSWRELVTSFTQKFSDDELLAVADQPMGRVPYLAKLPLNDPKRAELYAPVSSRIAVYQRFSADRAVSFCRWLSQRAGDSGDVLVRFALDDQGTQSLEPRRSGVPSSSVPGVDNDPLGGAAEFRVRIRSWRTECGLTQAEAAERVGCTPAAWGHWERGLFLPSAPFRRRIEELLRASVSLATQDIAGTMFSSDAIRIQSPTERGRRLLAHLASFGELAPGDLEDLGLEERHLTEWLDSLLSRRPEAYVATPLFFHLIDGDAGPCSFTTRLAACFMGEHLRRHAPEPIPELEEHIWARFGRWHLTQPHSGDQKTHAYLSVPIREPRDVAASERLDLFAQLPPKVIGDLIREPDFLSEQQSWSADAASKSSEGPLSTQPRRSWKRPLLLSTVELLVADDGQVLVGEMERTDVIERSYVVAGLPLCRDGDWEPAATLGREAAAERLFQHPVAAALLQFEVHRLFAGLSGDVAALIHVGGDVAQLDLDGAGRGPLWRHVRSMLEQVGYWPVGASTQDALWATAVQVMLKNLELLDVFERDDDVLRLTDAYQSRVKAHPAHLQNRGEKPYRVRLSQFLAALHGG